MHHALVENLMTTEPNLKTLDDALREDLSETEEKGKVVSIGGEIAHLYAPGKIDDIDGKVNELLIRLHNEWTYGKYLYQCALRALGLTAAEEAEIPEIIREHLHKMHGIAIDDPIWIEIARIIQRQIIAYELNYDGTIHHFVHGQWLAARGTRRVFLEGVHYEPLLTMKEAQEWMKSHVDATHEATEGQDGKK
ncbi:MAG: hypothetical protein LBF54_01075 [Holosporaceae bacterium]|jgi:predicted small metal-binding protein|nr:hypothetical protein [Holosporaceae bacterium]